MDVNGRKYNLSKIPKNINLQDITNDQNGKLAKLFSIFDDGDRILTVNELQNVFNIFSRWDKKDVGGKSDDKLTDDEIQQAIKTDKRLKGYSVEDIKSFIMSILNKNEKNVQAQQEARRKQRNQQALNIANDLYNQISGPSINAKTIEKLKQITPENAAQVLYEYEDIADESLSAALNSEWGFKIDDIKKYVCMPLIKQASGVSHRDYSFMLYQIKNIDDIKELVNKMSDIIGYEKQPKEKPEEIAKLLYNQISSPSLNKNTLKLLRKITSKNAAQVVFEYQKLSGQSLADAIDEEWGLDYEDVKKTIVSKLIRQGKREQISNWRGTDFSVQDVHGKRGMNTFIDKIAGAILQSIDVKKYIPENINPNDYTLEKLKSKYPKCTIRHNGNQIQIRNNDGSFQLQIIRYDDGHMDINKQYGSKRAMSIYDRNGQKRWGYVENSSDDISLTFEDHNERIVENLIEDLSQTKMLLWATTKERIKIDVSSINPNNVIKILNEYKKQTGNSLIDSIKNAPDIDKKDIQMMLDQINNSLNMIFSIIIEDVANCEKLSMSQYVYTNGVLSELCTNNDFPDASKKALIKQVYQIINAKLENMDQNNLEHAYTEDEMHLDRNSISNIIAREKAIPKATREKMLTRVEDNLSQSIENMDIYDYMWNTLGYDYDNIKHPTKVDLILFESGLTPKVRTKLLKQLKDKIFKEYFESNGYDLKKAEDISRAIDKEIEYLAKNTNFASGELLDHLFIKLLHRDFNEDEQTEIIMPNGKIDQVSYQGRTGDCWLLASINAIAQKRKGREILNNSIKINNDKSVTVTLRGVNKTYTFSLQELINSNELSTGDLDVRALEKAVEKYMMEEYHDDINGNSNDVAYNILIGNTKNIWSWSSIHGVSDDYLDRINNSNVIVTASFQNAQKEGSMSESGEELFRNHSYTVVKADKQYVYLINPWDSGSLIKITHEKFKSIFEYLCDMDL